MTNYPDGVSDNDPYFDVPSVEDQDDTVFYCTGYDDTRGRICGDEVDLPDTLCPACQRDADGIHNYEWADQYK